MTSASTQERTQILRSDRVMDDLIYDVSVLLFIPQNVCCIFSLKMGVYNLSVGLIPGG
jgi:hypothetical protein